MAYGLIIAAIRPEAFSEFKTKVDLATERAPLPFLAFEKIVFTTHYYLSAGTGDLTLNMAMIDLLDMGEIIDKVYWHPYRPPLYQNNLVIKPKITSLKKAYEQILLKIPKDEIQYWNMDFNPIIDIIDFITENNFSILTFLNRPMDKYRADKVHYPIHINEINNPTD